MTYSQHLKVLQHNFRVMHYFKIYVYIQITMIYIMQKFESRKVCVILCWKQKERILLSLAIQLVLWFNTWNPMCIAFEKSLFSSTSTLNFFLVYSIYLTDSYCLCIIYIYIYMYICICIYIYIHYHYFFHVLPSLSLFEISELKLVFLIYFGSQNIFKKKNLCPPFDMKKTEFNNKAIHIRLIKNHLHHQGFVRKKSSWHPSITSFISSWS